MVVFSDINNSNFFRTSGNMSEQLEEPSSVILDPDTQEDIDETPSATLKITSRLPKKRRQDRFEQDIINVLKSNVQPTPMPDLEKDPDEMFLLSQLPAVKQLSQSEKMDFQIKFLQLLQTYNKPQSFCKKPASNQHSSEPTPTHSRASITPNYSDFEEDSVISLFQL